MTKGYVHSLESFGSADGPGVRYIVFLSGCAMRCQFCHNPDTWQMNVGTLYEPEEIIEKAIRFRPYWKDEGGITVSGGEPLLQIDFLIDFFKLCKKEGINTTLDTSGQPFTKSEPFYSKFLELMEYTDLVMLDIKEINDDAHIKLTAHTNSNILDMARELSDMGKDMWIRHVLVPNRSDNDEDLNKLSDFIKTLNTVKRVEVLPYHTLGVHKWKSLNITNPLEEEGITTPTAERVQNARQILGASN